MLSCLSLLISSVYLILPFESDSFRQAQNCSFCCICFLFNTVKLVSGFSVDVINKHTEDPVACNIKLGKHGGIISPVVNFRKVIGAS